MKEPREQCKLRTTSKEEAMGRQVLEGVVRTREKARET